MVKKAIAEPGQTKICKECGSEKDLSEFYVSKTGKFGRAADCKACTKDRNTAAARLARTGCGPELFKDLLEAQGGKCAVCRRRMSGLRRLSADHCHQTGKIRGILCSNCNRGLGLFQDDPALLRIAADYLEKPYAARDVYKIDRVQRGFPGHRLVKLAPGSWACTCGTRMARTQVEGRSAMYDHRFDLWQAQSGDHPQE